MTDRISSLVVVLDDDYREDDVQHLVEAIKCLKGVISVKPNVVDHSEYVARCRLRFELRDKILSLFYKDDNE